MAVTFELQMDEGPETEGVSLNSHEKTLRYYAYVDNGEGHAEVRAAAKQQLPTRYANLIRHSITVLRRITFDTVFELQVEFRHPGGSGFRSVPVNVDDVKVTIESVGSQVPEKMTFSKEAVLISPREDEPPVALTEASKRVIGFNAETGKFEGISYEGTSLIMHVETIKSGNVVTPRYLLNAAMARGKVNAFPYKGFPRGTLRLIRFSAAEQQDPGTSDATPGGSPPDWNLSFTFEIKPNWSGRVLMKDPSPPEGSDGIGEVPIRKEGHWHLEYIWTKGERVTYSVKAPDGEDIHFDYPAVSHAILHRVFDYEDFQLLLQI